METLVYIIVFSIPLIAGAYSYLNKRKDFSFNYMPIEFNELSPIEIEFVRMVNEHRINLGLNALIPERLACEVCKIRVLKDIAEDVEPSHYAWERLITDAKATQGGHVAANSYTTAKGLFIGYMGSTGHKEALENPNRTHIGTSFIGRINHTILTKYD